MAITSPFLWGSQGQKKTPEQIARERDIISELQGRVGNTSPVDHWLQGAGRVVDAITGKIRERRADASEEMGMASADDFVANDPVLASLINGTGSGVSMGVPSGAASAPSSAAVADPDQQIADDAMAAIGKPSMGGLPASIVHSESGGNWGALNSEGYGGRGQFGAERLADAARAGVIPAGMTGASYSQAPEQVQLAVEDWHKNDILNDLGGYVGVDVDGPGPIPALTPDSILAVAHLGGTGGARKFIESGGRYNPSDSNGTSLADYATRHAGGSYTPRQGGSGGFGGGMPQQDNSSVIAALSSGMADPWVAKKYGPVLQALMGQQMRRGDMAYQQQLQQNDPYRQAQLKKAQLEIEQMRNPQAKPIEVGGVLLDPTTYEPIFDSRQQGDSGFTLSPGQQRFDAQGNPIASGAPVETPRPMNAQDRAEWNIPPDDKRPYVMTPDGPKVIGGGGVTVNNDLGGDKFEEAFAKGDATALGTISESGMAAQRNLGRIDQLEGLLSQSPTGLKGVATQLAGGWGINTDGLSEVQAAQALINSMVPEQRQPGSGPMSDADLALFKQSLPRIINQPGGNDLIIQTMRAIAQYDAEGATIVQRLRAGEIDRATAFAELQGRQNPLQGFKVPAGSNADGAIGGDRSIDFSKMSAADLANVDVMSLTPDQQRAMMKRFKELDQ